MEEAINEQEQTSRVWVGNALARVVKSSGENSKERGAREFAISGGVAEELVNGHADED